MEKVRQLTEEEMLFNFHNKHLEEYMSAKINVNLAKVKCEEDPEMIIGQEVLPPMAKGMPPSARDLRAKDYLKRFEIKMKQSKELLDTIKDLIKSKEYYA